MAKYSIEDTTLTGIADAVRSKSGVVTHRIPLETKVSKTENATSLTTYSGSYASQSTTDKVTIEGADYIVVKVSYQTEGTNYDYLQITAAGTTGDKLGGKTLTTTNYTFNTDTVSFYFKADGSTNNYLGYYAEVTGYKVEEEDLSVKAYTPLEMPAAILAIGGGGYNTEDYNLIINNEGTKYTSKYTFFPNISDYYTEVSDIELIWYKVQEKASYLYIKGLSPIYSNGHLGVFRVLGGSYSTMKVEAPPETENSTYSITLENGITQSGTINGYPATMLIVKKQGE
jgi:hypothetical protein